MDKDANPSNLDWERWLGKAPKIPWTPEHYFSGTNTTPITPASSAIS